MYAEIISSHKIQKSRRKISEESTDDTSFHEKSKEPDWGQIFQNRIIIVVITLIFESEQ